MCLPPTQQGNKRQSKPKHCFNLLLTKLIVLLFLLKMTQIGGNTIMEIEGNDENHYNESYDATDHQEALQRFNATMDQRTSAASRIIQSDSIMKMEMDASNDVNNDGDNMATSSVEQQQQPQFPKLTLQQQQSGGMTSMKYKVEYRRIRCPSHRYTPLREHWEQILTPLVEYLKLQVRLPTTNDMRVAYQRVRSHRHIRNIRK